MCFFYVENAWASKLIFNTICKLMFGFITTQSLFLSTRKLINQIYHKYKLHCKYLCVAWFFQTLRKIYFYVLP